MAHVVVHKHDFLRQNITTHAMSKSTIQAFLPPISRKRTLIEVMRSSGGDEECRESSRRRLTAACLGLDTAAPLDDCAPKPAPTVHPLALLAVLLSDVETTGKLGSQVLEVAPYLAKAKVAETPEGAQISTRLSAYTFPTSKASDISNLKKECLIGRNATLGIVLTHDKDKGALSKLMKLSLVACCGEGPRRIALRMYHDLMNKATQSVKDAFPSSLVDTSPHVFSDVWTSSSTGKKSQDPFWYWSISSPDATALGFVSKAPPPNITATPPLDIPLAIRLKSHIPAGISEEAVAALSEAELDSIVSHLWNVNLFARKRLVDNALRRLEELGDGFLNDEDALCSELRSIGFQVKMLPDMPLSKWGGVALQNIYNKLPELSLAF
ncbi:hypothetical protein QJQ45_006179 [Haematococcus lacustris]|nr:hypothetical protein QJQ45_006179 [Haematococcus lacustris]